MIDLKYELVGASRLGNQQDVPVVITLHGMGSNYLDLRPSISFFNQKVIELHFQGSIEYANGYAYYIPRFFEASEPDVIGNAAEKIYEQTQRILKANHLEGHPLAVIGFSQGAILATTLMTFHPEWLQAALVLSGRLPDFISEWARQHLKSQEIETAVFISQGKKDIVIPPEVGHQLFDFFRLYAQSATYHEYDVGHGITMETARDAYEWTTTLKLGKESLN